MFKIWFLPSGGLQSLGEADSKQSVLSVRGLGDMFAWEQWGHKEKSKQFYLWQLAEAFSVEGDAWGEAFE